MITTGETKNIKPWSFAKYLFHVSESIRSLISFVNIWQYRNKEKDVLRPISLRAAFLLVELKDKGYNYIIVRRSLSLAQFQTRNFWKLQTRKCYDYYLKSYACSIWITMVELEWACACLLHICWYLILSSIFLENRLVTLYLTMCTWLSNFVFVHLLTLFIWTFVVDHLSNLYKFMYLCSQGIR